MHQGFKIDAPEPTTTPNQTPAPVKQKPVEKPKDGMFQALMTKGKKYYYSFLSSYSKAESFHLNDNEDRIHVTGMRFKIEEGEKKEAANARMRAYLESHIWFSYRSNFNKYIQNTKLSNDIGWGCMIRCGQMLLCKTIMVSKEIETSQAKAKVLAMFRDNEDGEIAPFSIHNLVLFAQKEFLVEPGQWFRATTIMMSLDAMNKKYFPNQSCKISILAAVDSLINVKEIYDKVFQTPSGPQEPAQDLIYKLKTWDWANELLFCVAIRIGLAKPQENFKKPVQTIMRWKQSVGILGGKESKAYYIVGYNTSKLKYYYLDPHYVQEADYGENVDMDRYKPRSLYEYSYEDMVTSLMPAFYIRNKNDFADFYNSLQKLAKEVGEDNMPFSFNLDSVQPDEHLIEF